MSGNQITIGYRTDVGQYRDNNQDSLFVFSAASITSDPAPYFGLFIVADGMGGHDDGEKASGLATHIISQQVLSEVYIPLLRDKFEFNIRAQPLTDVLVEAIQEANQQVLQNVPGAKTTVTAVALLGSMAYFAHAGDSRAYVISSGEIEQMTRDHSLVQRLIDVGQLTPEEALEHPQQNILYRSIGLENILEVDMTIQKLLPGSYVLICSDGLWNLVGDEEMVSMILDNSDNTPSAAQALVDLANERGGTDNISVIVLRVPE